MYIKTWFNGGNDEEDDEEDEDVDKGLDFFILCGKTGGGGEVLIDWGDGREFACCKETDDALPNVGEFEIMVPATLECEEFLDIWRALLVSLLYWLYWFPVVVKYLFVESVYSGISWKIERKGGKDTLLEDGLAKIWPEFRVCGLDEANDSGGGVELCNGNLSFSLLTIVFNPFEAEIKLGWWDEEIGGEALLTFIGETVVPLVKFKEKLLSDGNWFVWFIVDCCCGIGCLRVWVKTELLFDVCKTSIMFGRIRRILYISCSNSYLTFCLFI